MRIIVAREREDIVIRRSPKSLIFSDTTSSRNLFVLRVEIDGQAYYEEQPLSSSYLYVTMRKLIVLFVTAVIGTGIYLFINRSIPYSDRAELLSDEISIDSVWTLGPTATVYDKTKRQYYWLKSYSSFNQLQLDTLKHKKVNIRYMKFFKGPLENRIFRMEMDSVVIFNQVLERN